MCVIHLIDIRHCLNGEEDKLLIGIAILRAELKILAQRLCLKAHIVIGYLPPFACLHVIGAGVKHLCRRPSGILTTEIEDTGGLGGLLSTESLKAEGIQMVVDGIGTHRTGIPRHVHEEGDGIFHRLEVAHVEDPHTVETVIGGKGQLFPHVLRRSDIEPLRISRRPHVVHMIIEAPTARMLPFLGIRHTAQVAPVVVAEQDEHVIGHTHALVIVVEYFLIECPYLWGLAGRFPCHLLDNLALVLDDGLQQLCVSILAHRLVAVATHADGHDIVGALHPLDTPTEEAIQVFLVLLIVPGAPLAALAGILLMIACHWLVMAGADNDTHLVGRLGVFRIVGVEGPTPHGRPEEIALQTENELKHFLIETVIAVASAEGVLHPGSKTRGLVVEEDATIAHDRLAIGIFAPLYIDGRVLLHGYVGPVIPR